MAEKYKIDTSDTHKYGEIWVVDSSGNLVLNVYPIGGDEDMPNYDFAKKICSLMNEGVL